MSNICITSRVAWLQMEVPDPALAGRWFCENFWFEEKPAAEGEMCLIENGNCRLMLIKKHGEKIKYPKDASFAGFEHVSLETNDIGAAIDYCKSRGMALELDDGGKFHNPLVWGTGMDFFNIITDFGVKVEICRRLDKESGGTGLPLVFGVDHIGIETSNIKASIDFYKKLGFCEAYEMVTIPKADGVVYCSMMALSDTIIELFEFSSKSDYLKDENNGVKALVLEGPFKNPRPLCGPDGEAVVLF